MKVQSFLKVLIDKLDFCSRKPHRRVRPLESVSPTETSWSAGEAGGRPGRDADTDRGGDGREAGFSPDAAPSPLCLDRCCGLSDAAVIRLPAVPSLPPPALRTRVRGTDVNKTGSAAQKAQMTQP